MNIEKNKPFLLKIPFFEETFHAVFVTKNNKDYILVTFQNKRIFKICLNEDNESEYYEDDIILSTSAVQNFIVFIQNYIPEYFSCDFNYDNFFIDFKPLKIKRDEIKYSLYVEEPEDYLQKNNSISKIIEIKSDFFTKIVSVFMFRIKNKISYSLLVDAQKIVKFEFEIYNGFLNLIKEERYNHYSPVDFLKIGKEFNNLTSTSHEMQKDIQSSDTFFLNMYKEIFII